MLNLTHEEAKMFEKLFLLLLALFLLAFTIPGFEVGGHYFSQFGNGNQLAGPWALGDPHWCTVACLHMLFDYYDNIGTGAITPCYCLPPFDWAQPQIWASANTCTQGTHNWPGTMADDARRAAHFSIISSSAPPGGFVPAGYCWRDLGYAAYDGDWTALFPPPGSAGIDTLKALLDAHIPLIVHAYNADTIPPLEMEEETEGTEIGHSLLLIGYNDSDAYFGGVATFEFHDPWRGANVKYLQLSGGPGRPGFYDAVWPNRLGQKLFLFAMPWQIEFLGPDTVSTNTTFNLQVVVTYPAPPTVLGAFPLRPQGTATLTLYPGLSFAPGEVPTHNLPLITTMGTSDSTQWQVQSPATPGTYYFGIRACGQIDTTHSTSYPTYMDSIGGIIDSVAIEVVLPSGIGEETKIEENAISVFPNPFNSTVTITFPAEVAYAEVYNLRGELVEVIPVLHQKAFWGGESLPSGIYILKAPGVSAKTLIKLR